MRITSIEKIEPRMSRCIEVDSPDRLFAAGGEDGRSIVTHNSVVQRNIIFSTIMRPESWRFLGIDLKRVELSGFRAYSNVVLGIATELEDAVMVLRFASQTMMKRYAQMEELGVTNFIDLPERGQALLVMIDEAGELLSEGSSSGGTDEQKEISKLKGEASELIGSIARLGRAAGVHLVIATQRPDATLIKGETKANLHVRINCGRTDGNASSMILGSSEGTRVRPKPRGRLYIQNHAQGDHGQGFFANQDWIDQYLAEKGLNPDGSPLETKRSRLANIVDMNKLNESTLDEHEGIDNESAIDRIRQAEIQDNNNDLETVEEIDLDDWDSNLESNESIDDDDDDWGFVSESDDDVENTQNFVEEKTESALPDDPMGRPSFNTENKNKKGSDHRPEEDWDDELAELIKMNRTLTNDD